LGRRSAFLLRWEDLATLREGEGRFFRPAVGTATLQQGQLKKLEFVFYPYGKEGLLLTTEDDLQTHVPSYYEKWLLPRKRELGDRPRFQNKKWWELSEKREWQVEFSPRLVSTYFGQSGSFAFDHLGEYAVVNGHAWLWTKPVPAEPDGEPFDFSQSRLPWAYVALLNSTLFEEIMSWYCVPLRGAQMRLERRFLSRIPLPDFTDDERTDPDVLQQLTELGKAIDRGGLQDVLMNLDTIAREAYHLARHGRNG
jgi:hypothetical protein